MAAGNRQVRVWGHASILYWWIVWLYGFFCAAVTYGHGQDVTLAGAKFRVYEGSWLGTSFLSLVLFVIMFSTVRVRGYIAFMVLIGGGLIIELFARFGYLNAVMGMMPSLVIFMNFAFYLVFSSVLLVIWLVAFFGMDRLNYWTFDANHAHEVHTLDHHDDKIFPMIRLTVNRQPVDFMRKVLGLGIFGFGTGDIVIKPEGENGYRAVLQNVWRVDDKLAAIQELRGVRPAPAPAPKKG